MRYYKIQLELVEEYGENDREGKREAAAHLAGVMSEYNQKDEDNFLFVSEFGKSRVEIGAIVTEDVGLSKFVKGFTRATGLRVKEYGEKCCSEITYASLRTLLRRADHMDYIEDADEVLNRFGIGALSRINFGENLVRADRDRERLFADAKQLYMDETLLPELGRISAGKSALRAHGHPVHYMVETDDREARREAYQLLLSALYADGRLENRRYAFLDFNPHDGVARGPYEALYRSCEGGAVVVRYSGSGDDGEEEGAASEAYDVIEAIGETARAHRNGVLTVLCLPRVCSKVKAMLYEHLDTMSFVEMREDLIAYDRAVAILKKLAKERHVRVDKALLGVVDEDGEYLANELCERFEKWYEGKLKTSVYPQYKDISAVNKVAAKASPRGSAYAEFSEMIGLGEAKAVMAKALNYYKMQRLYEEKGVKRDNPAMHMVFSGNPGTAKTTVARLFARIMRENGLLARGHLVEVGRGDLVGRFTGWTAPTVQKKFAEAIGGVLFIDEAYSLVDDRDGSFGDEAINTIVQEMENHREDLVVIFAGYPDKMESFLQKNPGLRSRIAFHVPFADYSSEELCEITRLMSRKNGMQVEAAAMEKLVGVYERARTTSDFGNGRYVRNVFEQAKMNQASRLLEKDFDSITTEDVTTITAEDIVIPQENTQAQRRRIGFC